jgi:hypothetical protein
MSNDELNEDGRDYEFTFFLMRHGWDIEVARKIGISTGCEEEDDILDIPKMKIDSLDYLTDEQKENLWKLVCDRWRALSVEERKKELITTKHREHKEMILQILKRDDVREKRLGELILRMLEIIGDLPLNAEWREELIRGLNLDEDVAGSVWESVERWKKTSGHVDLMMMCRYLWWSTDPSREEDGHEGKDIFNLITKWKGLCKEYRLTELENVLLEFNSIYCKYALLELEDKVVEKEYELQTERMTIWKMNEKIGQIRWELKREERNNENMNAELQRVKLELEAEKTKNEELERVKLELEKEKKKNEELHATIWHQREAFDASIKRARIQGLLLRLEQLQS